MFWVEIFTAGPDLGMRPANLHVNLMAASDGRWRRYIGADIFRPSEPLTAIVRGNVRITPPSAAGAGGFRMLTKIIADHCEPASLRAHTLNGLLLAIFDQADVYGG